MLIMLIINELQNSLEHVKRRHRDKIFKFINLTERGRSVRNTLKKSGNPVLADASCTWF